MAPRVLLVDDEANILRMLAALLQAEGFSVDQAANGHAALQAVREHPPDAVLLDLLMPRRDPTGSRCSPSYRPAPATCPSS